MRTLMLVNVISEESFSDICDSIHLPQGVVVLEVRKQVVQCIIGIASKVASGLVNKHLDVSRRVKLLQNLEVLLEVLDRIRQVVGLLRDLSFIGAEPVSVDSILVQYFPVL